MAGGAAGRELPGRPPGFPGYLAEKSAPRPPGVVFGPNRQISPVRGGPSVEALSPWADTGLTPWLPPSEKLTAGRASAAA